MSLSSFELLPPPELLPPLELLPEPTRVVEVSGAEVGGNVVTVTWGWRSEYRLDSLAYQSGSTVIVVGVGHLIGPDSVPALLRARGVKVEGP